MADTSAPVSEQAQSSTVQVERPVDALDAAQSESSPDHKHITVHGRKFRLVKKVGLGVSNEISKASESDYIHLYVSAAARLIHKSERDEFVDFILDEPDDEDQAIDLEEFFDIMNAALEAITGRPTSNTDS